MENLELLSRALPGFLVNLLKSPPLSGEGVHNWLFRVSRQLHAHLPEKKIVELLQGLVSNCGRQVPRSEIVAAVQNSLPYAWQPNGRPAPSSAQWPTVNKEQREAILAEGTGLADLWELSPIRIEDNQPHTEGIIDQLFPGNSFLCCGKSNSDFDTRPREEWRHELGDLQFIVPSPMSSIEGVTKDGRPSRHTLSNTGPRRFLVVEFDTGSTDEHAALLIHLARRAPLVMAVHSGGKSLHGWFYCAEQPEEKLRRFMEYAVSLGADQTTWTPCQFVRMPDGRRDNGRRQVIYYFNPRPLEVAR